jgi:hypothetical protein
MNPVQFYESTIRDNETNVAFSCVVLPARSLPEESEVTELIGEVLEMKMPISRDDFIRRQLGGEDVVSLVVDRIHRRQTQNSLPRRVVQTITGLL